MFTSSLREFVVRIARQEVGQERFGDGGERAERLQVAGAAAVAFRLQAFDAGDALVGNQDVAEFSAEAHSALDDVAIDDDAAAETGADHRGDRSLPAVGAEDGEVSPQGSGVAVVEVGDGAAETGFEVRADIESGPIGMDEVGGTARAEDAGGTRRTGRVQADGDHVVQTHAGFFDGDFQAVFDLPQADVRPFGGERGVLAQSFDEELLLRVDDRIVNGGPAKVDSGNYFHG